MKTLSNGIRLRVFAGAAALCAGAVFAQQPAFQPAPAPLPLPQPVQAVPAQQPAFQPAPAPVPLQQPVQAVPAPPPPPYQGQAVAPVAPVEGVAPPPPAPAPLPAPDPPAGGSAGVAAAPSTGIIDAESSMRLGVELSAEALAAAPYIFYGKGKEPGVGRVAPSRDRSFYQRYDKVLVRPTWKKGKPSPFKAGDTVDVLRSVKKLKIGKERVCLVARTARGAVVGFAGNMAIVLLTDVWDRVSGSERLVPTTRFIPVYFDNKPDDKGQGLKARVITRVDNTISPYMHQYIVLNKGADAGVKLGDFFKVMDRAHPKRFAEALVEAQAVNVTGKSSTLLLHKIYNERLNPRDEAYLNFRAAVKQ
jgi:hypothetical protein